MRSLRIFALLLSFAMVGATLAVCVGYSTDAAAVSKPTVAIPVPANVEASAADISSPDSPQSVASAHVPSRHERETMGPESIKLSEDYVSAETGPQLGQQAVELGGKMDMESLAKSLLKQLQPQKSAAPANITTGIPGIALPASPGTAMPSAPMPTPPGTTPGAAPSTTAEKIPKPRGETSLKSEVDGLLTVNMKNADIRDVLESLGRQGGLNILVGKTVQGTISATLKGVSIDDAMGAVLKSTGYVARREGKFIYVGAPADFDAMEHAMDKIGTRVYRPNYVNAAELQTIVQPLLTADVGVVSVSSPAEAGIGADETNVGGDGFAGAEVLVVRDYEAVLAEVDQMVDLVDVRPPQVHIEAMILSVKLKDEDKYGVDFEFLRNKDNLKFGIGSPESTLADFKFEDGALKVGFLDSNLGAFLEALESIGDTNVIATPQLMVVNKHRAGIQIGDQKGYVSTTVTETTSTQTVEFLEVGTILRLRPFISSDGIVRMEIHPELSSGDVKLKGAFTVPEKTVTQVTSNVMVRDGCTVVIGGLMREELSTTANQVPFFGNLPWVGFAFRSSTETTERREVIVLITPHIIYEPDTCNQGDKMACEFHRRQAVYADKMTPLNKRNVARRYTRLAKNAMAVGDRDRALRFAEMAVQFDPLSREAIDLRSNIWMGNPHGEHALPVGEIPVGQIPVGEVLIPQGVDQGAVDGEVMPEWLLGGLEAKGPMPQAVPLHPIDPGQPGPRKDLVRPRRMQ